MSHRAALSVFLERRALVFFHLYAWIDSLINWSNSHARDDGSGCWRAPSVLSRQHEEGSLSAIKMDRRQRRQRKGGRDVEAKMELWQEDLQMLRFSRDTRSPGKLYWCEGGGGRGLADMQTFITEPHYRWHPCWRDKNAKCHGASAAAADVDLQKWRCIQRPISVLFLNVSIACFPRAKKHWHLKLTYLCKALSYKKRMWSVAKKHTMHIKAGTLRIKSHVLYMQESVATRRDKRCLTSPWSQLHRKPSVQLVLYSFHF